MAYLFNTLDQYYDRYILPQEAPDQYQGSRFWAAVDNGILSRIAIVIGSFIALSGSIMMSIYGIPFLQMNHFTSWILVGGVSLAIMGGISHGIFQYYLNQRLNSLLYQQRCGNNH